MSARFMLLDTVKEIWEAIRDTYSMKKNVSNFWSVWGDKSLKDYYNHFKSMSDKLNQYHPVTNDIEVLKNQWRTICS